MTRRPLVDVVRFELSDWTGKRARWTLFLECGHTTRRSSCQHFELIGLPPQKVACEHGCGPREPRPLPRQEGAKAHG